MYLITLKLVLYYGLSSKSKGEVSGEGVKKLGLEKKVDLGKQSEGHNAEEASNVGEKSSDNTEKKVDKKDGRS